MMIAAYGAYLYHGGDPRNWKHMTQDDIQLIYIMDRAEMMKVANLFDTRNK